MKSGLNAKGFTLVEIMIVVAIVGLLASIAVPNFARARTTSRTNACKNNLRIISAAKDQSAMDNNKAEGAAMAIADISAYLRGAALPVEPQGGLYTINAVGVNPTCSIGGTHVLV